MRVAEYCGCLGWVWGVVVVGGREWESVCLRSVVLSAALRWCHIHHLSLEVEPASAL
jgi:hypothetical protein